MQNIYEIISKHGIIPTVTFKDDIQALNTCKVLNEHSIKILEVMLRSEQSLECIQSIKTNFPDFLVGAGTVKNINDVKLSIDAGADFVVTPYFEESIIKYCTEKEIPIIPGTSNPREIASSIELGISVVKLFPAEPLGGEATIKLLTGVFPQVKFIPTGGITKDNFRSYLDHSSVLAVGGGFMLDKSALGQEDFEGVGDSLKETIEEMLAFKLCSLKDSRGNEFLLKKAFKNENPTQDKEVVGLTTIDYFRAKYYLGDKGFPVEDYQIDENKNEKSEEGEVKISGNLVLHLKGI